MSYCVNCGVELHGSAGSCPLCNTPVINPREAEGKKPAKPFPEEKGQVERVKRKDLGILVTVVALTTAVTCGVLNYLVFSGVRWSLAVIGVCVLLWVMLIPAVIYTRQKVYSSLLLDGVAVVVYLYLLTFMTGKDGWFFGLGMPIVVLVTALAELFALCVRILPKSILTVGLYVFTAVGILCSGLEILIDLYLRDAVKLGWSAVVLTVIVIVDIAIITLLSIRRLRSAVRRRLHF